MLKKISAIKAIKIHCKDCSGGSTFEVKNCIIIDCVLWPFRLGKNPNRKSKNQPNQDNVYSTELSQKNACCEYVSEQKTDLGEVVG